MAVERDEQEERLARIEQILEQLKAELRHLSELNRRAMKEDRITLRAEEAGDALRKERQTSQRRGQAAKKKR